MPRKKREVIKQELLQRYFQLRESRVAIERSLREQKKEEDELKTTLTVLMNSKAKIERGDYDIELVAGARRPNWKQVVIDELGKAHAEMITANTPAPMVVKVTMV